MKVSSISNVDVNLVKVLPRSGTTQTTIRPTKLNHSLSFVNIQNLRLEIKILQTK